MFKTATPWRLQTRRALIWVSEPVEIKAAQVTQIQTPRPPLNKVQVLEIRQEIKHGSRRSVPLAA